MFHKRPTDKNEHISSLTTHKHKQNVLSHVCYFSARQVSAGSPGFLTHPCSAITGRIRSAPDTASCTCLHTSTPRTKTTATGTPPSPPPSPPPLLPLPPPPPPAASGGGGARLTIDSSRAGADRPAVATCDRGTRRRRHVPRAPRAPPHGARGSVQTRAAEVIQAGALSPLPPP